jgi:hypothetical protein
MPAEELRRIAEEISARYRPVEVPLRVQIMPIDPFRAHAYWNVPEEAVEAARREMGDKAEAAATVMRIYGEDESGAAVHRDFTVSLESRNWYVNAAFAPARPVIAEIGLLSPDGVFRSMVRSEPVTMPRGMPSPSLEARYARVEATGRLEFIEVRRQPSSIQTLPHEEVIAHRKESAMPAGKSPAGEATIHRPPTAQKEEESRRSEPPQKITDTERNLRERPAWMRAIPEHEIEAFYERLRAAGNKPREDGKTAAPSDAAREAVVKFLEACRRAGITVPMELLGTSREAASWDDIISSLSRETAGPELWRLIAAIGAIPPASEWITSPAGPRRDRQGQELSPAIQPALAAGRSPVPAPEVKRPDARRNNNHDKASAAGPKPTKGTGLPEATAPSADGDERMADVNSATRKATGRGSPTGE